MASELISSLSLWQEPFMQRALIGGVISGILGGWVGSIAVLRQLSFFAEALGQASLLGISLALLLGLSPPVLLWPFALGFAWLLRELLKRSALSADALLSLMCSGALALSVVLLSSLPGARLSLQQLLFGDILGIAWADLLPLALLLVVTLAYGVISRRAQILISIDPVLARSRGVAVETHRMILLGLLALVGGGLDQGGGGAADQWLCGDPGLCGPLAQPQFQRLCAAGCRNRSVLGGAGVVGIGGVQSAVRSDGGACSGAVVCDGAAGRALGCSNNHCSVC